MKSDDEVNEQAYEEILKDHSDVLDVKEKYLEVLDAFKTGEDSPILYLLTENIVMGLETALVNLDHLIEIYVNNRPAKGVKKRDRIN